MSQRTSHAAVLAELESSRFEHLREAQRLVLAEYEASFEDKKDVAIELPTGAGKSLIALLVAEAQRRDGRKVAILTGNKTLARQMETEANDLGIPVVRMEGSGPSIPASQKRRYHRAQAVGVMNYWVYFNQNPVIDPADLLVMDDAHLAEHCLNSLYSVDINRAEHQVLFQLVVQELAARFPEYAVLQDALDENAPPSGSVELLSFLDQSKISSRLREIVDASPTLQVDTDLRFRWRRARDRVEEANIYLSDKSIWIRPYVYPLMTNRHYAECDQRIYMSATIGDPADLARRLGSDAPEKIDIAPGQSDVTYGRRLIVMNKIEEGDLPPRVQRVILTALRAQPKSVWLCASHAEATKLRAEVSQWLDRNQLTGQPTWILSSLGDEIDQFKQADRGHLFVAGRFDGMDFNADQCRLVVLATLPKATNIQEEFLAAQLQDPAFLLRRMNQRVIQALGRCNRAPDDYAIYVLADRRFATHFGRESNRLGISANMVAEIDMAEDATEVEVADLSRSVAEFLDEDFSAFDDKLEGYREAVPKPDQPTPALSSEHEVRGWVEMYARQDYLAARENFRAVVDEASRDDARPVEAFARWSEAKAAFLCGQQGDVAAESESLDLLEGAIGCGGCSSWFNRLRTSINRHRMVGVDDVVAPTEYREVLINHFDDALESLGRKGTRFQKWVDRVKESLDSDSHAQFQEGLEHLGKVLGFSAVRPKHGAAADCRWRGIFGNLRELVTFEAKIESSASTPISASDVGQAHNQAQRARTQYESLGYKVRGTLVTHLTEIEEDARSGLGEIRIVSKRSIQELGRQVLMLLSLYRDAWSPDDVEVRLAAANSITGGIPAAGWLSRALATDEHFLRDDALIQEWERP